MAKVLIVGAGGVGQVVTHKCAQVPEVFGDIVLASRTEEKCKRIAAQIKRPIKTAQVDADDVRQMSALIEREKPTIVINVALPYQDLPIMDACLATGVDYLDTANYEPRDTAKFEYSWQWAYQDRFRERGIMALLGSGFDPGVTNVFTAYLAKHHFDTIEELDIIDCNAGDHGQPFATNFNPEINIREITSPGRYWEGGAWRTTEPLAVSRMYDFPEGIGPKKIFLLYHEELESIVRHFPTLRRARFWMTFSENYLTHLRVLENVGMTSIEPVAFQGQEIIPLQFLKALLPDPASLGPLTKGKTCIGCLVRGRKDGKEKVAFVYNICDHEETLPRGAGPGDLLHHRRAGDDRREADAHRQVAGEGRVQPRAVRPRSVHGGHEPPRAALDGDRARCADGLRPGGPSSMRTRVRTERFRRLDPRRVPSPCFVVDEWAIEQNLRVLDEVERASGAKILLALKAFSMWRLAPLVARYLAGTCASGLHEARLGREEFGGEVHTFAAAYTERDLAEILEISDHVVFNSFAQWERFQPLVRAARARRPGLRFGLRVNPEQSEGENPLYDPSAPYSRLGIPRSQFRGDLAGISGLHFHTLCEQDFPPLARTVAAFEAKFGEFLPGLEWVNFGGGHHITRPDYQVDDLVAAAARLPRAARRRALPRAGRGDRPRRRRARRRGAGPALERRCRSPSSTPPPPATCPT